MSEKLPASLVVAGIAMGICAFAGIAYYMGWGPWSRAPEIALAPRASPPAPAKAPAQHPDVPLLPGESLVSPPDPIAAPAPAPPPPTAKRPSTPQYAKPPERRPAPVVAKRAPPPPPSYSRARPDTSYERSTRSVCVNCGVVTGMTRHDYDWEVRVRFDDGTRKALRSYDRPRVEIGDTVHLEDGRLIPD